MYLSSRFSIIVKKQVIMQTQQPVLTLVEELPVEERLQMALALIKSALRELDERRFNEDVARDLEVLLSDLEEQA